MGKKFRLLALILSLLLVGSAIGFVIWGNTPARPMSEALSALRSDTQVNVISGDWLAFTPTNLTPETGLILYPGGRIDYRAYAPLARQIASQGYLVVIVPMPLNLAVFGANTASEVIAAYPQITRWVIGGHSLGGAMAASFASKNTARLAGLVLWAAYPASSDDLSASSLRVASIYASLDGLSTPAMIDASRPLLPPETTFSVIEGGNHAQFGWYGDQASDHPAAISRQDQQAQIAAATLAFLESLK